MKVYNGNKGARATAMLLLGSTVLAGMVAPADAQTRQRRGGGRPAAGPAANGPATNLPQPSDAQATAITDPNAKVIKTLRVEGAQRIEPETVLSYTKLRVGSKYTAETLDQALKDLAASELFADYTISGVETGDIVLRVRENPIINRVIFEGNKHLKDDKITKEVKLKPRQIFTRTAVRQDVGRIIELYRRQGRFAAVVEPKMVSLDQNRVDIVFEVSEGPKSKVRQINIIGNDVFSDGKLREQMYTKQSRWFRLLSSGTSYDQDRLAADQQKLRQFYLTEGYADFRVTSAVAELTPDKKDFIITYVVEEGKRYHFGDVTVDSEIRDFDNKKLASTLPLKKGDWYNAKLVEDAIDNLSQAAGLFGYAFTDVSPEYTPDHEALTMTVNFHIAQAQRTYVERVEINGNTQTQDRVVRREIRLAEGDAFNSFQVKRSNDRINSLGYFQDKFEIKQNQGTASDRVVLESNIEEKPTGQLELSLGYSSLERFIVQANITQRNFRGRGQELRAGVNYSYYSKSVELGFTEPYLFDKNVALGIDLFRRDYNSFNTRGSDRNTTYSNVSTGFQIRAGMPLTEFWQIAPRYQLSYDQVGLSDDFFTATGQCNRLVAGNYLCDAIGNRLTSAVGYSLLYNSLNSQLRPTAGARFSFSQDFAGLGGDTRYIRTRVEGSKFKDIGSGFVFSLAGEAGYIRSLEKSRGAGIDRVRITDRFTLGEPQFHGFDIRGIGPRIKRFPYTTDVNGNQVLITDKNQVADDALGGNAYYLTRAELQVPLGAGARELGLRPSIYLQAGSLFGLRRPLPTVNSRTITGSDGKTTVVGLNTPRVNSAGQQLYSYIDAASGLGVQTICPIGTPTGPNGACAGGQTNSVLSDPTTPVNEVYYSSTAKPRVSVGVGVNWTSPFGPLRIDVAKALLSQPGDDRKLITFNVGTTF